MTERAQARWKRYDQLKAERSVWEAHWEEIAERVLPRYRNSFLSTPSTYAMMQGEKRTEKMFDATAAIALERFAAAMESMLTPRNSRWHRLRADNDELNKDRDVRMWFDTVNDRLFRARYSTRANYAGQQHEVYMGLGAFGTGSLFIDERVNDRGLRYRATNLSEMCFDVNHQGVVDTMYRCILWKARQIVQRWPDAELPDKVAKAARGEDGKADQEFELMHVVAPRDDWSPGRIDAKGMPFMSLYILREEYVELEESGYNTFPYTVSRYVTAPGEKYGRSPAMTALPSIKTLNEQKKAILKQGNRIVDPVLLAYDDGVMDSFSLTDGAINFGGVSKEGRQLVHTLPTGNLAVGDKMMDQERQVINEAFLVSLFQILVDSPQMTATEVLERAREKGALLSPTMGRQQSEALGPQIERELDVMSRQGMLPPMPPILTEADGEYEIEYDSPLSRAQKAEEASGFMRSMEFALNYANVTGDPGPLDWFNMNEAIPALADIHAVPVAWISSAEQVEALRQQRAEAAQRREAIEAAPAAAGLMKATQEG